MEEILVNPIFRYLVFPFGSAILGIYIKYVTRNDQYSFFTKEDIAVGLELITTATLMLFLLISDRAASLVKLNKQITELLGAEQKNYVQISELQSQAQSFSSQLSSSVWIIIVMILALWGASTVVRKWGWKNQNEMRPVIGITIPLLLGILALITVMVGAMK